MAYITTVDHVRHLRRRNQDNGHFVDPAAAEMLSSMYVRLYDPPGINGTVFDGEGNPMTSDVLASDLELKLAQGFTVESPESITAQRERAVKAQLAAEARVRAVQEEAEAKVSSARAEARLAVERAQALADEAKAAEAAAKQAEADAKEEVKVVEASVKADVKAAEDEAKADEKAPRGRA
jgi:hypothetical protein